MKPLALGDYATLSRQMTASRGRFNRDAGFRGMINESIGGQSGGRLLHAIITINTEEVGFERQFGSLLVNQIRMFWEADD